MTDNYKTHLQIWMIFVIHSFETVKVYKIYQGNKYNLLALYVFANGYTTSFPSVSFPGRA